MSRHTGNRIKFRERNIDRQRDREGNRKSLKFQKPSDVRWTCSSCGAVWRSETLALCPNRKKYRECFYVVPRKIS